MKPSDFIGDKAGEFLNRLRHIGKRYYCGKLVRWLIADKNGKSVYCNKCRNIANGIDEGRMCGLTYRIPFCNKHLNETTEEYKKRNNIFTGSGVGIQEL